MVRSQVIILLICLFSGCSSLVQKVAISETSGLLLKASDELWQETDLELVEKGVPGLIKLIEGLHYLEPRNTNLLSSLTKSYAGHGFLTDETNLISSQLIDEEDEKIKYQLERNYTKAVAYGFKFLEESGVSVREIRQNISKPQVIKNLLDKLSTDKATLEAVFFTGQSLGSLILLNRDDLRMVAQRPLASSLFEWVCEKDPNFNVGSCYIFKAMDLSLTPAMLGGDADKGKEYFKQGIKQFPDNWIIRTAMLRYHTIPQEDEDEWEEQKRFFIKNKRLFKESQLYSIDSISAKNTTALFQALAIKRFDIIHSLENEIF